jgi:deoxyribodipyrimidine photo-lyase
MRSIILFKRDLRFEDNRTLLEAYKNSKELIPIFIFNKPILKELNSYNQKLGFIIEALQKISQNIKLYIFYGEDEEILEFLFAKFKPDVLYTSESFTWNGEKRNKSIENICIKNKVIFRSIFDNFLVDFRKIPYTKVFTHFYKKWINFIDNKESNININNLNEKILNLNIDHISNFILKYKNLYFENSFWKYNFAFERLKNFDFDQYSQLRNRLDLNGSSRLSPYIRFGILSIRKIYNFIKNKSLEYVRQLAWREFWYHIKYNFQEFNNLEFQEKRRNILWDNNEKLLNYFFNGKTGYPIIDAGIRQLKFENWMHNRARLIVANFLVKDLLIDWRIGEKFFKDYLLDYDEVVNVGNWQWCASVGPDPKPFRIFNPIIQSQKFDPNCEYIKSYIPELKREECYKIYNPLKYKLNYYSPIVNHFEQIEKARDLYLKF